MRNVDEPSISADDAVGTRDQRRPPSAPGSHRYRRLASLVVAYGAVASLVAAGCSRSGAGVAPDHAVGRLVLWDSIGETAACEAMNPQYCRGAFGFVIDRRGGWRAGPTPTNTVRSGTLDQVELAALSNAIHARLATLPPGCTAISGRAPGAPVIAGVRTVETLTLTDGRRIDIGGPGDVLPHPCPAPIESDTVRARFEALLAKYYPLPFTG